VAEGAASLAVGEVIAGKYRIEGILGSGGMATVFSAWHEELEQRVALKMLHAGTRSDPTAEKRFVREARHAARIQSEHVARIIDVGRTDGDLVYIVMEYLEGNDLSRVLKARGPLPVGEVVEHLVQACDAIAVAHSMGIVHRDLKPANLFLTRRIDGTTCVKVLDFGIAKAFDTPEANELTSATTMIGSPMYMAPEQMANAREVDARADIWSLGVIAYRLLTRQLPFQGENVVELAMNIASKPPRPLRELRPDVSPVLEMAVMRCFERDPDARWPDVGAFVQTIAPYGPSHLQMLVQRVLRVAQGSESRISLPPITGENSAVTRPARDDTSTTLTGPVGQPSATSLPPPAEPQPKSRRAIFVALALIIVAGAGTGVFLAKQRLGRTAAAPARAEPEAKPIAPAAKSVEPAPVLEDLSASPSAQASAFEKPKAPAAPIAGAKSAAPKPSAKPSSTAKDVWGWGE